MAAVTNIRYDNEFSQYYERKVKEGKPKMAVLNAIRNKIVLRVFACVRDQRKYEYSYAAWLVFNIEIQVTVDGG